MGFDLNAKDRKLGKRERGNDCLCEKPSFLNRSSRY